MSAGSGLDKFIANFTANLPRNDEIARNFVSQKTLSDTYIGYGGCCKVRCLQSAMCKMWLP